VKGSQLNIKYCEYDESMALFDKLYNSTLLCETQYVAICADDDFISLSGINQCINFLDGHSEYGMAYGKYISFWPPGNQIHYLHKFFWRPRYKPHSCIDDNPISRLVEYFTPYTTPVIYAVYRKPILEKSLNLSIKCKGGFGAELVQALASIYYTKLAYVDVLFAAREKPITKGYDYDPNILKDSEKYLKRETLIKTIGNIIIPLLSEAGESKKSINIINDLIEDMIKEPDEKKLKEKINFFKRIKGFCRKNLFYRFLSYHKFRYNRVVFTKEEKLEIQLIKKLVNLSEEN